MALHFQCLPTELDPEQVQDYLYGLQKKSNTPSQSYFKHTVYGLRFLLKGEGLPYEHLHLPSIQKAEKLPVILSREEIWRMLTSAQLLKHRILIGLLYGCGLRCQEVRSLALSHPKALTEGWCRWCKAKGTKTATCRYRSTWSEASKPYVRAERPTAYLFEGTGNPEGKGFDSRYSQRGVQWAVKTVAKQAGLIKDVHTHALRHSYATHLLEDGVNIITVQKLMGHQNIESTMVYLHVCHLPEKLPQSPLDNVFVQCSRSGK
jgi:integrase/recombinase XerD